MSKNPPAFPQPMCRDVHGTIHAAVMHHPDFGGATLRDYFAVKAMAAIIAKLPLFLLTDSVPLAPELPKMTEVEGDAVRKAVAELSFEYAEAMLTAREAK